MLMKRRMWFVLVMLAWCCVGAPGLAFAEQPGLSAAARASAEDEEVTIEGLRERLEALGEQDAAQAAVLREAISRLERAATLRARAAEARAAADSAPERLAEIRAELAVPPPEVSPEVAPDATLAQLEQGETQAAARLAALRNSLAELQTEAARRQDRRAQIPETLARLRPRLAEVNELLSRPPAEDATGGTARRLGLLAERRELRTEIEALEAELSSYEVRRDLLPARRDLEARRVAQAEKEVSAWQSLVSGRRQQEAQRAAREAERLRREAARQHPVLQEYASETQALTQQRLAEGSISQQIGLTRQRASEAAAEFNQLETQYQSIRQRIEASGVSRATGLALRREYESLPDASALERRLMQTRRELEEVEYTLFELSEAQQGADDISGVTAGLLEEIAEAGEVTDDMRAVAVELATARRDVLASLYQDADAYQEALVGLEMQAERLHAATEAYGAYIRERIFWVRSISGDRLTSVEDLTSAATWLGDPGSWRAAAARTWEDIQRRFPLTLFMLALLIGLFAMGRWAKKRLGTLADLVSKYRTDSFGHSLSALMLTLTAALPGPAVLVWLGWVLVRPESQPLVAVAVGEGLRAAGLLWLPLAFVRQTLRPTGLALAHFRWPEEPVAAVRRTLRWYVPLVLPAVAVMVAVDYRGDESLTGSLGRIAFSVSAVATAIVAYRLGRPHGPLAGALLGGSGEGWWWRLRFVWFGVLVLSPLALLALAWLGYFYTAVQLTQRIEATVALGLALGLTNGLLARWLFLARRRVAVEDARRRREQSVTETEDATATDGKPTEASIPPVDEDKVNLPGISSQTKQLFRTAIWVSAAVGLFAIWADVLPALRILERVEVYPTPRVVATPGDDTIPLFEEDWVPAGAEPAPAAPAAAGGAAPSAPAAPSSTPSLIPPISAVEAVGEQAASLRISLADVALALFVLALTFLTFKNLPGLIEMLVLQRLPLDAGSRYALATVLRYAIVIVGMAVAFSAIHVSWENVQWLAAALTFGLAFGLQEIFANFISGLIILAERPIRIGDTVTVGQTSGTVTRIRMRATTITDWDRKELIIPNKTFITGDVVNWTLSDPLLRVIIPVGVSYGADVRKTEATLLRVASEQPDVLRDPKPYVLFNRFGDSTLDFELRAFIPHIDRVITVRHDLHMRITEAFRREGIEIAFPQRDLHIRSIPELPDIVARRGEGRPVADAAE